MGAHYFLGNQLLGSSNRPPMWDDWAPQVTNIVLLCPDCGDVWARVVDTSRTQWNFQVRACSKHGNGSFIASWRNQFEELPPEVLHYELNLRLAKEPL